MYYTGIKPGHLLNLFVSIYYVFWSSLATNPAAPDLCKARTREISEDGDWTLLLRTGRHKWKGNGQQYDRSSRSHTCLPAILHSKSQWIAHITATFLFNAIVRIDNMNMRALSKIASPRPLICIDIPWRTSNGFDPTWFDLTSVMVSLTANLHMTDWCQGDFRRRRLDSPPPNGEAQMKGKWTAVRQKQSQSHVPSSNTAQQVSVNCTRHRHSLV